MGKTEQRVLRAVIGNIARSMGKTLRVNSGLIPAVEKETVRILENSDLMKEYELAIEKMTAAIRVIAPSTWEADEEKTRLICLFSCVMIQRALGQSGVHLSPEEAADYAISAALPLVRAMQGGVSRRGRRRSTGENGR